jgi:Right handed beta helix region
MTSRVRCSCGRVYDPAKHTTCPDCGAESTVESVVVAEKIKPPVPPNLNRESAQSDAAGGTQTTGTREGRAQLVDLLKTLPWPVYAGAAAFILVLLLFSLRPRHSEQVVKKGEVPMPPPVTQEASPTPSFTIPPSEGPATPPGIVTGVNLAELIANAKPDATITVPAGLYPRGLVLSRAVHIVGDSRAGGQVMIQSEGKECISVRAKGVSIQNVQFWCKGIGELPAVSVADGADLQMEDCKIESTSALGLLVNGNASIKALGSEFTVPKGTAARLTKQAQASFTQCSFSNSQIGLTVSNAAKAELHSCAFEGIGAGGSDGAIMLVADENTQLTGEDCQFTNNSVGINVRGAASMTLTGCTFKQNVGSTTGGGVGTGVVVVGNSAQVVIRNSTLANSSPYAIDVMGGGTLTLEDSEISGSRTAGLVVGERNAPAAHADVKRSRFLGNASGIGVYGGSTADVQDSECRENNDGIVVFDQGSRLKLTKTNVVSNRDHGLYAYGSAEVTAVDSNFQGNGRGAQSGTPRKSSQRASIRLENCQFGGNRVFGAGASTHSELVLANCAFDGTDKTNVYHERGAVVRTEGLAGGPEASPEPTDEESSDQAKTKHKTDRHRYDDEQRRRAEDISRIIRRFLPGR